MISVSVSASVVALQAAVTAAGTLANASQQTLAPVKAAVAATLAEIDAQSTSIEATIDQTSVGGIHVGTPAPLLAAALIAQSTAVVDLSTLKTMRGYVARIGRNLDNAPG